MCLSSYLSMIYGNDILYFCKDNYYGSNEALVDIEINHSNPWLSQRSNSQVKLSLGT